MRVRGVRTWLPFLTLVVLPACGDRPPAPLPIPPLDEAARARLARNAEPATWDDLDPAHPGQRLRDPRTGVVFRRIPGGEFDMGTNDGAGSDRPQHRVRLTQGYLLAETELTVGQWRRHVQEFAGDPNVPADPARADLPVPLSFADARGYCERYGYRMPSEAEWERACAGGLPRDQEPWRTEAGMRDCAWFHRNADMQAHPVGTRQANAFGLFDMLGNLWEWCDEDWHPAPYLGRQGITVDPHGPSTNFDHVLRGGSWFSVPPATPRTRMSAGFAERSAFFGCRPARSLPQ